MVRLLEAKDVKVAIVYEVGHCDMLGAYATDVPGSYGKLFGSSLSVSLSTNVEDGTVSIPEHSLFAKVVPGITVSYYTASLSVAVVSIVPPLKSMRESSIQNVGVRNFLFLVYGGWLLNGLSFVDVHLIVFFGESILDNIFHLHGGERMNFSTLVEPVMPVEVRVLMSNRSAVGSLREKLSADGTGE